MARIATSWQRKVRFIRILDQIQRIGLTIKIGEAFRPGAPIDSISLFAGRSEQVMDIIGAVGQPGRHVIMYGERGVGKTSLSRVLFGYLSKAGVDVISPEAINCDGTDDFSTLWHKVFREMSYTMTTATMGFRRQEDEVDISLETMLPANATPDDVRFILSRLAKPAIICLDELDRLKNQDTTTLLADTIKNLSDHAVKATLILIGVADSVEELIQEHRSIERALVQVHMPRMSREELYLILDKGMTHTGMTIEETARTYIVELSVGLPHFTHSLALYAAKSAITDDRLHITMADVNQAVRMTAEKSGTIMVAYHKATISPRHDNLYADVLLACALAAKDDLGFFTAASVRVPLSRIKNKPYNIPAFSRHLDDFCSTNRGPVLHKIGIPRQFRFRFVNPLMQPFVIIHGLSKGLLREDMLDRFSSD